MAVILLNSPAISFSLFSPCFKILPSLIFSVELLVFLPSAMDCSEVIHDFIPQHPITVAFI